MTGGKNSGKGRAMKHLPCLLALLSLSGLAACATDHPPPMYCPPVRVLEAGQVLDAFLPGRSDVAAQITEARITGVAGSCTLEKKKGLLVVKFQAGFTASDGPADHGAPLTLPYFVSISQGEDIVSKNAYSITLTFDGNESEASAVSKPITVELPNQRLSTRTDILVSFQLTPAELAYAAAHPAGP
jgi:hypothetical protein